MAQEGSTVSSAQQKSARRNLTARLLPVVLGISAAALVAGCGAGQITQTATQVAAVNGASGTAGAIAVRDAQLAFPSSANKYYSRGDNASVIVTIANSGATADTLTSVSSPAFKSATITGTRTIAAHSAVSSGKDVDDDPAPSVTSSAPTSSPSATATTTSSASTSSSATSTTATTTTATTTTTAGAPLPIGTIRVVLTGLTLDRLTPGQTVEVRFTFAASGDIVVKLPIGATTDPRGENS
jgi:copper(I)-binding protein